MPIARPNGSVFLPPHQLAHLDQGELQFDSEPCLLVIEINLQALSETPVASSLCLKLSKSLTLMFCLLLMHASEPGGLIEDLGGVVKEVVSLLRFSDGLGTILETTMRELESTFFSIAPGLFFLRPCLSLKKVRKHKGTDWTRFAALHPFPDCMDLVSMQYTVEVVLTVKKQKHPSLVFL